MPKRFRISSETRLKSICCLSFISEISKSVGEDHVYVMEALARSSADSRGFREYAQHFGVQTVNRITQRRRYERSFHDLVHFVNAAMSSKSKYQRTPPACRNTKSIVANTVQFLLSLSTWVLDSVFHRGLPRLPSFFYPSTDIPFTLLSSTASNCSITHFQYPPSKHNSSSS
jgi:hypothetical protein